MKYIVHICNDVGGWGRGFVLALSKQWAEPERSYREWFKAQDHSLWGRFELGNIQSIQVRPDLYVIQMLAQEGYGTKNQAMHQSSVPNSTPPIRYKALEQCLEKVAVLAKSVGASVHMPKIGSGLAGGDWSRIEEIINRTLIDSKVYVYVLA